MLERFTDRAKKVIQISVAEALQLGHNYVGTEHLLLALFAASPTPVSISTSFEPVLTKSTATPITVAGLAQTGATTTKVTSEPPQPPQ